MVQCTVRTRVSRVLSGFEIRSKRNDTLFRGVYSRVQCTVCSRVIRWYRGFEMQSSRNSLIQCFEESIQRYSVPCVRDVFRREEIEGTVWPRDAFEEVSDDTVYRVSRSTFDGTVYRVFEKGIRGYCLAERYV